MRSFKASALSLRSLNGYIKMCRNMSPTGFLVDRFVDAVIRLLKLEGKLGKTYEEALREFNEKAARVGELNLEVDGLEKKGPNLEAEASSIE